MTTALALPRAAADSAINAEARLAAFRRSGDPADLWPGLTEPARVAASREIERVTRRSLAGETSIELDPARVHSPYALLVAGHTSGMGPVVGSWIERGTVVASAEHAAPFAEHLAQARARNTRMECEALPALDALLAIGVTPVVLKGFHTARAYFDDPSARRMSDIDILVPASRVRDVEHALRECGYRPDTPALKPYKRDWLLSSIDARCHSVELAHERSRWILEVHASLDRVYHPGAIAKLDVERAAIVPFEVCGRMLAAPAPELLLVYLACHCSQELDGIRLLRLFELARLIRAEAARGLLDWDRVRSMLDRADAARYTYPALALVEDLVPGTVDPRVVAAGRRASTWAAKHTVARLAPAGGSLDDRGILRQLMWTRGTVAIGQRVLRNFWPAAFDRPADVLTGWRMRLRRLRRGLLWLGAPDERR